MKHIALITLGSLGISLATAQAHASEPAGVWVKVQKVVFEPNATAPTRIQIHGAAMMYDGNETEMYLGYTKPAFGYLYYECPSGQSETCLDEWRGVQNNVGTDLDACIGLGSHTVSAGSLRAPNASPAAPDVYPIAMGVLQGFTPCAIIGNFLRSADAGTAGTGGSGGSGGAAGAAAGGTTSSAGTTSSGGAGGSASSNNGLGCAVSAGADTHGAGWWLAAALGALVTLGRRRARG